jgi:hypothetical protein
MIENSHSRRRFLPLLFRRKRSERDFPVAELRASNLRNLNLTRVTPSPHLEERAGERRPFLGVFLARSCGASTFHLTGIATMNPPVRMRVGRRRSLSPRERAGVRGKKTFSN